MSACRQDDSPWCAPGTCARCDEWREPRPPRVGTMKVDITDEEARHILAHVEGPERGGLEPTTIERSLMSKMRAVLRAIADETLPRDDAEREAVRELLARHRGSR